MRYNNNLENKFDSLSIKTTTNLTISSKTTKKRMKIDLFEVVKKLHNFELFDDVLLFIEFNINLHKLGDFYEEDEQAYIYYCQADSNFHLEHYSQCVKGYEKVKQLLNIIRKQKLVNRYSNILNLGEINYRAHLSLLKTNSPKEAVQCLESIPKQELRPKMLVALAKLQLSHHKRNVRTLVKDDPKIYANFKAVLDEIPEAIYCASYCAMSNSVSLSVSQKHYLLSAFSDQTQAWIQAKCSESSFKFIEAAAHMSKVSSDSYKFILELARYYHIIGDQQTAMNFYQRAHAIDETQCEGMDAYAALLAKLEENKILEILANKLMQFNHNSSEAFVAFGHLARIQHRIKEAQIFCQKACEISTNRGSRQHSQALFLKAKIQFEAGRAREADKSIWEAIIKDVANLNFIELFIQTYIQHKRCPELSFMDRHANHTPRVKYFNALCSTAPENSEDSKKTQILINNLEEVVEKAPYLSEAVELLVSLYDKHKMVDKIRNFVETKNKFYPHWLRNILEKYESQESFTSNSGGVDNKESAEFSELVTSSVLNPISKASQSALNLGLFTPEMSSGNFPTPLNRQPPPIARQRPARHLHRRISTTLSTGIQTRRTRGRDNLDMLVQPRFDDDDDDEIASSLNNQI